MTAEEAIKIIEIAIAEVEWEYPMEYAVAFETAIEALEKTIAKKPVRKNPICYCKKINGEEHYAYYYYCPICGTKLTLWEHHCTCGQAIDWGEE